MGCIISRNLEPRSNDNGLQNTTKTNDLSCLGIKPKIEIEPKIPSNNAMFALKQPRLSQRSLGIQPRFRLDISSSSSSESDGDKVRQKPYRLVEKLGEARMNIQISSDSSGSEYSYSNQSTPGTTSQTAKHQTPDVAFLSSRRDNQSIDDVGNESVYDWLATDNGSEQLDTLISEDDAKSALFSFQMATAESPSKLATPRKLIDSMDANDTPKHEVKSTERVERRHVDLPKNMPPIKSGDWLSHRYVINDYIILNEIGRGAFAEVRLCKNKTTNMLFAVKIMSRKAFDPKEVAIMKKLRHPNVLQLYEVLDDQRVNKVYLVTDYLKRGDLMALVNSRSQLTDLEVWNVTKQIMRGLNYLHQNNVVHNDLKPSNILLGDVGENDMRCVIADFGIATPGRIRMESAGTPSFMGPEVCSGEAHDGRLADCYSLGATIYCIRIGRPPFIGRGATKNAKLMDLHHQIKHAPLSFPIQLSHDLKDLICGLMEKDPRRRLPLNEAMTHVWMQKRPMKDSNESKE